MLCRMLLSRLTDSIDWVYLANPSLSPEHILHAIAYELGMDISDSTDKLTVMRKLQETLLERHSKNRKVVVLVEEAQGMPLASLEEIRLLSCKSFYLARPSLIKTLSKTVFANSKKESPLVFI